jgi:hypothetical protein
MWARLGLWADGISLGLLSGGQHLPGDFWILESFGMFWGNEWEAG